MVHSLSASGTEIFWLGPIGFPPLLVRVTSPWIAINGMYGEAL